MKYKNFLSSKTWQGFSLKESSHRISAGYRVVSYRLIGLTTVGDPWCDEGCLLLHKAKAVPCSESYCLLHSTYHLPPCVGLKALQAGVCVCVCCDQHDL